MANEWHIHEQPNHPYEYMELRGPVVSVGGCAKSPDLSLEEQQLFRRQLNLFAAAPDLLALAKAVIAEANYLPHVLCDLRVLAESALAKAESEASQ